MLTENITLVSRANHQVIRIWSIFHLDSLFTVDSSKPKM